MRAAMTGLRALLATVALAALTLVGGSRPLDAQDATGPDWQRWWSPLRPTAELARAVPGAWGAVAEPLPWGPPRVGLAWTAGNPAALPFELRDRLAAFAVSIEETDGDYRRPLDPARSAAVTGEAVGWRPFGGSGAAIGRVGLARSELYGAMSDFDASYAGSPYVVLDTAGSDLGRTSATLEGAAGWRLGPVGLGVAAAYRAQNTRTLEAPVPRVLAAADPSAAVGAVWAPSPAFRVGLHGRWRAHAERVLLYSVAAPSRVYLLQGYFEPPPQDVANGFYTRRVDRDGTAFGASAGGTLAGAEWVAFAESGAQQERQHSVSENDPDVDTWTTDALTVGAGLTRAIRGDGSALALTGRLTTLSGEAARADLPDTITFVTDELVFEGAGELRLALSPMVTVVGRFTSRYDDRTRRDQLARVRSEIAAWTSGLGLAATLRPAPSLALSAGAALSRYGAGGGMPNPSLMGVAFGRFVAPELALMVTDAGSAAAAISALWDALPGGASLWVRGRWESLSPRERGTSLSWLPEGSRSGWSVSVGVVRTEI